MPSATQQTFPKLAFDGGVTFEDSNETRDSYRCDHVSSREFDKIVEGFDDLGIDQIASYKEMERPGLTSRFVSYRNGEAIGAAVVVNYALPVIGRGVANVRFGPIWRRKGNPIEFRNYRTIVRQLIQEYAGNRGHMLTILPKPHPKFAHDECELLESMGFHSRTAAATSSRFMVNLDLATRLPAG